MRWFALLAVSVLVVAPTAVGRSEVRLENEHVRMVENLYEPGEESPLHSHDHARAVYVLDGGELELVDAAGEATRVRLEPGQAIWRPAETHVVRNVGRTAVRVLETEIKGTTD